jgi:hypothetical protein
MEESSQKKYDDIFITIINIVERQTHTHDMMEKYNFGVKPYIDQIEFFFVDIKFSVLFGKILIDFRVEIFETFLLNEMF